jgi:valacyclovir hydrolase
MSWFEHAGHRIYYEESGDGAPVLLMPGRGGTIEEMMQVRQALASKFRVMAADLPGSGKSGPQPCTHTPRATTTKMLALLKALNASPAHLLGFSDGGEYALLMGAIEPSAVKSIVTWGSAGQLPPMREMVEAMRHMIDDIAEPQSAGV